MKESWNNEIKRKFEDYQEPAPEGLWEQIEARLDAEKDNQQKQHPQKVIKWYKPAATAVAAACAILLAVTQLFKTVPETTSLQMNADRNTASHSNPIKETVKEDLHKPLKETDIPTLLAQSAIKEPAKSESKQTNVPEEKAPNTSDVQENPKAENTTENNYKEEKEIKNSDTKDSRQDKRIRQYPDNQLLAINKIVPSHKNRGLHISLSASKLPDQKNSHDGYGELMIGSKPTKIPDNAVWGEDPMTDILLYNRNIATHTKIKHKFPIRASVALKYDFNDRFGIEGGLEYTYLSSEMVSGSENYRYETEQQLHYLGLSLKGSYSIWRNKRWNLYLSAGGAIEKCVHGEAETEYILANKKESSKSENISIDEPQWSVNASAGVQYNITDAVGIYAEPGASYFFKNNAPIENIYKDKPLNFNMRFGVRFTIK